MSFYVAAVAFICVLVVLNIFLVMSTVVQEKKDKVQVFVLSLPVSTRQYLTAKITASLIAFLGPWAVLTAGSLIVVGASAIPDGLMPVTAVISTYMLLYYCALLALALVTDSQAALGAGIIAGNISINFAIPLVMRLPSVAAYARGPVAVWSADVAAVLAAEVACAALAVGLALVHQSRKADFV
jgi:ABC-type transport system involved in multi-copper enzyme maturation permease subunit